MRSVIADWNGSAYMSGSRCRFHRSVVVGCAMASEMVICRTMSRRVSSYTVPQPTTEEGRTTYSDEEEDDLEDDEEEGSQRSGLNVSEEGNMDSSWETSGMDMD